MITEVITFILKKSNTINVLYNCFVWRRVFHRSWSYFKFIYLFQIPESCAEGDQGRDLIRYRQFTYDFSFWSVLKTERRYASQQQVKQEIKHINYT